MVLNVKTKRFVLTITIQLGASVNNLRRIVKVKFVNKKVLTINLHQACLLTTCSRSSYPNK